MGELVSIIVPVYNAERFLKECIQSVILQTYKNIELLLIDDGSTDKSSKICSSFVAADCRVHYHKFENSGVSSARNNGLLLAKGEYICFIDSDDVIENDYIETLYDEMRNDSVDIVFCNYQYLYGDRKVKKFPRIDSGIHTFNDIASIAVDDGTITGILFGSVCGAMYKIDSIKKYKVSFDTSIKRNEDGLFNLCILQKVSRFAVIEYDGYLYRQWKKSKSRSLEISTETEKATEKIKECCCGIPDLENQLKCRSVSVVFWNSMYIAGAPTSIVKICRVINEYLNAKLTNDSYICLDRAKMNKAKRALITMLAKRRILMFVLIIKYVYPLLSKIMKR